MAGDTYLFCLPFWFLGVLCLHARVIGIWNVCVIDCQEPKDFSAHGGGGDGHRTI